MRRSLLLLAGSLLLLAVSATAITGGEPAADPQRPNVLLITFDTTRADRLPAYGYRGASTPNIDRLAREGTLFEEVYAQAPQTMPNHTSLFTGLYTITHNVLSNGQKLSGKAVTLAEILHSNGYRTAAVVAAAPVMKEYNLDQGFRYYNDDFQEAAVVSGFKSFLRFFSANKWNLPTSRPAHRVTELGLQWLERNARKKKPFFLWLHYFDPHDPYEFHPDFEDPDVVVGEGEDNQYGYKEANYVNEIEFADHWMGKVLDFLDREGLTANTLTVFTADHGESLGEHGYRGHRQDVYQNIVRVPLIFRWPGEINAGERVPTPGMTIDVMPSLLSQLEIPYLPNSFQGKNLFALPPDEPRKLYSVAVKLFTKAPIRKAMVFGDWKFIEYDDPERNTLFNLRQDPEELRNLRGTEADSSGVDWLREIGEWYERHESADFSDFQMSPELRKRLESLGYVQD